jgi:hypothetical protein
MSGKGSNPRPFSVPRKVYEDNWEKIFGKNVKDKKENKESRPEKQK